MSGSQTRHYSHCPHCWGDCHNRCRLPGLDVCIHQAPKVLLRDWPRTLRTRRFWRRILFGTRAH